VDFFDRIDELLHDVGRDHVTGSVEVDQVYAKYQHERLDLNHPHGGHAQYLKQAMVDHADEHMRRLAKHVLEPGGVADGMREVVDQVARDVHEEAPREFGDLRNSAHPTVVKDDVTTFDVPPLVPRLTEAELREKDRLRDAGHDRYPLDHPQHVANRIARRMSP
jgi:hypothetical protein